MVASIFRELSKILDSTVYRYFDAGSANGVMSCGGIPSDKLMWGANGAVCYEWVAQKRKVYE